MKRREHGYKLIVQSQNGGKIFELSIRADSLSDDGFLIRFWQRVGPFGIFRRMMHIVPADLLIFCVRES